MRTLVIATITFMLGGTLGFALACLFLARADGSWRWEVVEDDRAFTGGES